MEHPAVVEAGVIGVPDPVAGEIVKAFVSWAPGTSRPKTLRLDLLGFARRRLGPAVAPRQIAFDQDLPHTDSGKIMRRLLKARELGLPEGGLSTLEAPHDRAPSEHRRDRGCYLLRRWSASAASRSAASSCTARRRSAGSCTSTSARRPSPSG